MEISKQDVLTPANALSTAGLLLTVVGSANIDKVSGVAMVGVGRALDLADGYVARRTHASEFGAAVDATFDKLAVAAIAVQAWRHDAAPDAVLAAVVTFNIINAVSNVYADRKGFEAKTSIDGKLGMFGQNVAVGAFALANALGDNVGVEAAGWFAFAASAPSSVKASIGYSRHALKIKRATRYQNKAHNRQKR